MNSGALDLKMRRNVSFGAGEAGCDADTFTDLRMPLAPDPAASERKGINTKSRSITAAVRARFKSARFIARLDARGANSCVFAKRILGNGANRLGQDFGIRQSEPLAGIFC